ncbi:MAG: preprotein translocase subunit SecA [Verrucomicrobiae bacterium]|nr:preprotein translocase subunit SecA [Verrucomicrobiae bacterium]
MLNWLLKKIVGTKNQREIRRMLPTVARINEIEKSYQLLTDAQLQAKTVEFRERLQKGESLDDLLPEAFAVVKNACRRLCGSTISVCGREMKWDMVPFDVQLVGGMVLHRGRISEMATGEGKTLVATMPLYLNALAGNVHLVTVNDYLARRDSEWMGAVYKFLGLTVGTIQHDQPPETRRAQYACDITYGTNSEFGFDYLRDNGMATRVEDQVQRGHFFAIVDEVDSILIDEARTPLIISGPSPVAGRHQYMKWKPMVAELVRKQNLLCNSLCAEAKKLLDGGSDLGRAGRLLYQVKLGQPKHKQLLRLMETPSTRDLIDKSELDVLADTKREEMHLLKEELFFAMDEKSHEVELSEKGRAFLRPDDPQAFVLPDLAVAYHEIDANPEFAAAEKARKRLEMQELFEEKSEVLHNIAQLLRAYCLFEKDVEYVVQEGKVIIVDEFTGRLMPGRRWSDGLHQAVEAKEGVELEKETQTLATITIQNYFRLYKKLAGMTGTAETEANEFFDIYKLGVNVVPTNRPCVRADSNDVIYKTRREKFQRIVRDIQECHARGQPVLVGTISVETSELLSRMLKRINVPHAVLNAKYHQQEAEIVARAGQRGAVTIATNMAGRGTDIKLGEGVPELGGLHVIGTERHESRRIDRQLRGRCARQGDPGSSHFFISLEDDLMRLFASGKLGAWMEKFGFTEGQELEHPWLNRSVESAQKRVEQFNYQRRKHTLEYDDVMNKQREIVYGMRNEVLRGVGVHERIREALDQAIGSKAAFHLPDNKPSEQWDRDGLVRWANATFPVGFTLEEGQKEFVSAEAARERIIARVIDLYEQKRVSEDVEAFQRLERTILLSAIDRLWQEHLYGMDGLRTGIGLRSYGQRDPLIEYKQEGYKLFEELMGNINLEIASNLFRSATSLEAFERFLASLPQQLIHAEAPSGFSEIRQGRPAEARETKGGDGGAAAVDEAIQRAAAPVRREAPKVGRNDPCPCGSGRKFKQCCGKNAAVAA